LLACGCHFDVAGVGGSPVGGQSGDANGPVGGEDAGVGRGGAADLAPLEGLLSVTVMPAPAMADLTALGTVDWAHWGHQSAGDFDHRSGVDLLPDRKMVNSLGPSQYGDNFTGFGWSDGTPHASALNTTTGVFNVGIGTGFELPVPADTTARTLWLYVGGYRAEGTLALSLSDDSAPARTDQQADGGGPFTRLYRIQFRAATPGQTLLVRWTESWDYGLGNVALQAAALAN
jgi:hypothetical protein